MDFLLINNSLFIHSKNINEINKLSLTKYITLLYTSKRLFSSNNDKHSIHILGDLIPGNDYKNQKDFLDDLLNSFSVEKLKEAGGHFYCFRVLKDKKTIEIYSSFLNILPVYYSLKEEIVSSSSQWIKTFGRNQYNIYRQFILEKLFFNYPLFDSSIFENIKLIPAHSYLVIKKNGISIKSYPDISEWFSETPVRWAKNKDFLTDLYLSRLEKYFPEENYHISFTGGFDGRTLVSIALYLNKNFLTYSFGSQNSDDVIIPALHAQILDIPYKSFLLDDKDYLNKSLEYGFELVDITDGLSNFARAHYLYATKQLAEESRFILTGNFGSELFRAFHNTGVVVSPLLYQLFAEKDFQKIRQDIQDNPALPVLQAEHFRSELKMFMDQLSDMHRKIHVEVDLNKIFYKYIFEEVFRKYFGAEIKMQSEYLINRTPYLDPVFVREILKIDIAGVYSRFYENNPLKRFKGQLFYAELIKKTNPVLFKLNTGKGYAPRDLLCKSGRINILAGYLKKRFGKEVVNSDPFGVTESLNFHKKTLGSIQDPSGFFDMEKTWTFFDKNGWEKNIFINVYSLIRLLKKYE